MYKAVLVLLVDIEISRQQATYVVLAGVMCYARGTNTPTMSYEVKYVKTRKTESGEVSSIDCSVYLSPTL